MAAETPGTMTVLELLGPSTGGIRRHVATLADRLDRHGWTSAVAGPPGVMDGLLRDALVVDVSDSLDPRRLWSSRRELVGLGHFDLIHAHGLKAGLVALVSRPSCPVVLTIHNVVLGEDDRISARMMTWLERQIVKRVDDVIAVSPQIAQRFSGVLAPRSATVLLPASPSPEPTIGSGSIRSGLGLGPDDTLVVVVARLSPQKDLPTFLRAWRQCIETQRNTRVNAPRAHALIVGDGPLRAELEADIAGLGLADSVTMGGASEHAVNEIAAGDIFALSSIWEGAPLVICEAMQLGKPIVSTDVGVVADMVGSDGGRIVEVGDVDGLAAALGELMDDPSLAMRMGAINEARGSGIYGAEPLVAAVASLYRKVVGA